MIKKVVDLKKSIGLLKKLNDEKKKLAKEMDKAVSSKMRNVGYDKFESVNEMD